MATIHNDPERLFAASAPGRADFLNTHQDYKGLPVVPVALDLRTYMVAAKTSSSGTIEAVSLDLEEKGEDHEETFIIGEDLVYGEKGSFGNYLRAVAKVALATGRKTSARHETKSFGLSVLIKSQVPVSAGLGSSAALEICFATLLNKAYGLRLGPKGLAEVGFQAENVELGIPCGRLDQYGSSFGGVIIVECRPPYSVRRIPFKNLWFVVVDTGIRHSTAKIHPVRQGELNRGLKALLENKSIGGELRNKLSPRFDEAKWSELSEEELSPYLSTLDEVSEKRILFTLRMQRSTELALAIMEKGAKAKEFVSKAQKIAGLKELLPSREFEFSRSQNRILQLLGSIMNYQHLLLRDLYDVSLPEIENIREAMLGVEAYGVKISGAGLGGSVIALVGGKSNGKASLETALKAGAKQGWVSSVGAGARIENEKDINIQRILKQHPI
ncbi:MAG: galactokinase family protein [Promethearchaeati archaeon SRVP18_Atabeyarchaeia-1]